MKSNCHKEEARCRLLRFRRACRIFGLGVALVMLQAGLSAVPASAQNIQVSPPALSATVVKGQSTTLTLNLQKSGSAQHVWEPTTSVSWLSLSPQYGSINTITTELDTIRVTVNTANLSVGANSGLVYIWDTGSGSQRLITVPLIVRVTQAGTTAPPPPPASPPPASPPPPPAAPSPVGGVTPPPPVPPSPPPASPPPTPPTAPPTLSSNITAFPAALSATVVKGQSTTLTLNLQKSGSAQHVWEPTTSVSWLSLSPQYGSINTITTELDTIRVTVNTANLSVGANSGLVYIWDTGSGSQRLIAVPLIVQVTQAGTTAPPPPPASPPPASPPPPPAAPSPVGGVTPPPPPSPPAPTAGVATVTWATNSEADLAGYKVYVGTRSGVYTQIIDVGIVTSYRMTLPKGTTYFFSVTAYDRSGNESSGSAEVNRSIF